MSGAVIKAGDTRMFSRGRYSLDLRDIAGQASEMIASARQEARRIIDHATAEAGVLRESVQREARHSGREQGLAEGREQGLAAALAEGRERFQKDQASLIAVLTELTKTLDARREQLYLAARRDVVVLAVAIARRVLCTLPELDEAATQAAVKACEEALDLVRGATEVVVRANPDDCEALERLLPDAERMVRESRNISVVADAAVGRGGVLVESEASTVDATASSRVERIAAELVGGWKTRLSELSLEL